MGATNVSYASVDSVLEALVLHILPEQGQMADGIINNNLLFSYLKQKNRMEVIDGGLEFWNGVIKQANTNLGWQGHTDNMSADLQDPSDRLRYDIKTYAGAAVVINKKHEAMNKGKAMVKQWAKTLKQQAMSTIPNDFNSSFWAATPAADQPESIPSLISITPEAGTVGGLTRAGKKYLQNYADTDGIADIGSEAGVKALKASIIKSSIKSNDICDLVIMDEDNYAGICGYLNTERRYKPNEKMGELDFDTVMLGKTTIGYENSESVSGGENTITAGYVYGINSNYMKFKTLKDGNFKFADSFEQVGTSLNRALYFWVFCNLCAELPKANFVLTGVAST